MATRALGTTIKKAEQKIGSLTSINGIEITADLIDTTVLDSDGGYRESIGGFKDGGEVSIEGFFDSDTGSGQIELQTSLDAGIAEEYTITYPTTPSAEWNFQGVVTSFGVGDVDVDGTVGFRATIKVSGKPVLTIVQA